MTSQSASENERTDSGKERKYDGWSRVIQVVTKPLSFFTLVLLVVDVVLGLAIPSTNGLGQILVVVGMLLLLFTLVGIVTFFWWFRPDLVGFDAAKPSENREPRIIMSGYAKKLWGPFVEGEGLIVLGRFLKPLSPS
jgi:hypothetical protein